MYANTKRRVHLHYLISILLIWSRCFCAIQPPSSCNILDGSCRQQHSQTRSGSPLCGNLQNIWLIPGHSDTFCTRPGAKRLIEVNPRLVTIKPTVLKFPGCFEIEIKNIQLPDPDGTLSAGIFAKIEYQWLNMKGFDDFQCQNASSNGCGGFGNNCYYCDICESINKIGYGPSTVFTEQLRGMKCPTRPGYYTFRKEFCFNDWSWLNSNGDCGTDSIDASNASNVKAAFASLQQLGYGTIVAKIRLAHNASGEIVKNKMLKEAQIESAASRELLDRRKMTFQHVGDDQFRDFHQWYTEYKKNLWHREEYLPWLLYENEISCLRFTFNVCGRAPTRHIQGGKDVFSCD